MSAYVLHPERSERLETVTEFGQIAGLEGKFLYFSAIDTLVMADSLELFHKDIYQHLLSLSFRGLFALPGKPDGFGIVAGGAIISWKSFYFGETPAEKKPLIEKLVRSIERSA